MESNPWSKGFSIQRNRRITGKRGSVQSLSCVRLFETPRTAGRQASLSVGFSRQEYWSGLPCPPPGDLPNPGIELTSLTSPALADGFFTANASWEALRLACLLL